MSRESREGVREEKERVGGASREIVSRERVRESREGVRVDGERIEKE